MKKNLFFLVYTIRGDSMRTKEKQKGISLIVLIVTIIVVIILAAVVILTLSKNNPIESAKEARFKEDIRTFQDELALAVSKEYADAGGHRDEKITTADFDEIKGYIPSFSEKYRDKFVIKKDQLKYTNKLNDKEIIYAQHLNVSKRNSILPIEYQEVEYIEGKGKEYINTNYLPDQDIKIEVKYEVHLDTSKDIIILIYGNSDNFYFFRNSYRLSYVKFGNSSNNFSGAIYPNGVIVQNKNNFAIKNIRGMNLNFNEFTSQNPIYILNICNSSGNLAYTYSNNYSRIYYFKIWHNDEMVRNFIPAYSELDNKVGLYDTVEGKFYTNQGTGDFIPGPDVD